MINAAPSPQTSLNIVIKKCAARQVPLLLLVSVRKKVSNRISILLLLQDFQQENNEHMQPEVVSLLRSSKQSFFHHLVASSPEALFRWGVLRAIIRILAVFKSMGRKRAELSR